VLFKGILLDSPVDMLWMHISDKELNMSTDKEYENNARNFMDKITSWQDRFIAEAQSTDMRDSIHRICAKASPEEIAEMAISDPKLFQDLAKFAWTSMFKTRLELLEAQGRLAAPKISPIQKV